MQKVRKGYAGNEILHFAYIHTYMHTYIVTSIAAAAAGRRRSGGTATSSPHCAASSAPRRGAARRARRRAPRARATGPGRRAEYSHFIPSFVWAYYC